jgi:hypothetical protein
LAVPQNRRRCLGFVGWSWRHHKGQLTPWPFLRFKPQACLFGIPRTMRRSRIHRSASNSRAINKKGSNIRAPHRSRRGALTRRAFCYFVGMTRQTFSFVGLMVLVLDEFRAQRRQADLSHASERRVMFYAKPTRADAGQAGSLLGHSTQLGTEEYIRYIKGYIRPRSHCMKSKRSIACAPRTVS